MTRRGRSLTAAERDSHTAPQVRLSAVVGIQFLRIGTQAFKRYLAVTEQQRPKPLTTKLPEVEAEEA